MLSCMGHHYPHVLSPVPAFHSESVGLGFVLDYQPVAVKILKKRGVRHFTADMYSY